MRMHLTRDALIEALVDALAQAWGTRAGSVTAAPGGPDGGADGWLASWPLGGPVEGTAAVWFERTTTAACLQAVQKLDETPADADVEAFLRDLVTDVIATFLSAPPFEGVTAGDVVVASEPLPPDAALYDLSAADRPAWRIAATGAVTTAAAGASAATDERLSAVLEVELPLVVRFGRAVMPFRALAGLGPGSVIDMGRSPEEPVELLVGERLIARGEVVVVGGNYGVRITELTGARAASLEARNA